MKKYRVFKTFPVSAGTWHTEEHFVEGELMMHFNILADGTPHASGGFCISGKDEKVKAIFSKEYSVIEITNQQ